MSNIFSRPGLGANQLPPVNSDDNGKYLKVTEGAWDVGASDLPAVDESDNGKVLTVADGEWTVGEGGGGGAASSGVYAVSIEKRYDPDGQIPDALSITQGTYDGAKAKLTAKEAILVVMYETDILSQDISSYTTMSLESVGDDFIELSDPFSGDFYMWTASGIELESAG